MTSGHPLLQMAPWRHMVFQQGEKVLLPSHAWAAAAGTARAVPAQRITCLAPAPNDIRSNDWKNLLGASIMYDVARSTLYALCSRTSCTF